MKLKVIVTALAFSALVGCHTKRVERTVVERQPATHVVVEERRPEIERERVIERRTDAFGSPIEQRRTVTTDTTVVR